MPASHLRHADYALVPVVKVSAAPRNTFRQLIEITNVSDWTTLCIHAEPDSTGIAATNAGAVVIQVNFYQLTGTSAIPNYNNTIIVGGRSLCVGLTDQRLFSIPSTLDVRLPIIAPFVEIILYFPSTQTEITALNIGVWCTNDPSYQYGNPYPVGFLTSLTVSAADSIMGELNSGFNNTTRGIYVPANTLRVVEFATQTIGKAYVTFSVQEVAGAAITANEVVTWICTKSPDDISGTTMDQVIHSFGQTIRANVDSIPLVGFRQSIAMLNFTGGAARDTVWYVSIYPEFI